MIPRKNLDDKSFLQLVQEARQNIRRFSKEWTDENYHDPGITLLEMFSWLTEMQRYYLNRVTDRSVLSMLKLFGQRRRPATCAQTLIRFSGLSGDLNLPSGIKLLADEQIFETADGFRYLDNRIRQVFLNGEKLTEYTHINNQEGIHYPLFGEPVQQGGETVLIFEKPLPHGMVLPILFDVSENYPVPMGDPEGVAPAFQCQWYQDQSSVADVEVVEDTTCGFRKAGIVKIRLNREHQPSMLGSHRGPLLRVQAMEDSCATPPMVDSISLNAVQAFNRNTLADYEMFTEPEHLLYGELASGAVSLQGSLDGIHWKDISPKTVEVSSVDCNTRVRVEEDFPRYRALLRDDRQLLEPVLGSGTGLPGQVLRYRAERILTEHWQLQIGEFHGNDLLWVDWHYTDDLIKAGESDRLFSYDLEEEQIIFGNNEHGQIPSKAPKNIRMLRLIKTDFERGNVKQGRIEAFYNGLYPETLNPVNIHDAQGGKPEESIESLKKEVIRDFDRVYRAVTEDDYEQILREVPGYRMSYVRALANHRGENQISIIAVPYNGQSRPRVDRKAEKAMREWLEDYRLLTTRVDFIAPLYVEVHLDCVVRVKNRNRYDSDRLRAELVRRLTPIRGYEVNPSYRIGTIPAKSELIRDILTDTEIRDVEQLILDAVGLGVRKNAEGDIILPPNAILYAGTVRIEVLD